MDPKTEVMRTPDGSRTYLHHEMRFCLDESDIVAGNRYVDGRHGLGLVPDPAGYLVALITHRGENAPPRPATLPVGTRVRRGPDWRWNDQDGKPGNVGTVVSGLGAWYYVQWDGCEDCKCAYRWYSSASGDCYDLEVVSLPAEKPAKPAPKTWPDEAVLVDDTDTDTLKPGDIVSISTEGVAVEHAPTTLPRHHRVMLERLRAAGWVVTDSENTDVAEAGMATRSDTRILITPDAIRVVAKKPACTGTVGVSLDYACEQAAAVLEAAAIIDTVRSEWALASEHGAVPPVTPEPARRIIPVEGFHDMEHLLEDAEPAGIVPRPSR